jgi:hypothetical protein
MRSIAPSCAFPTINVAAERRVPHAHMSHDVPIASVSSVSGAPTRK